MPVEHRPNLKVGMKLKRLVSNPYWLICDKGDIGEIVEIYSDYSFTIINLNSKETGISDLSKGLWEIYYETTIKDLILNNNITELSRVILREVK